MNNKTKKNNPIRAWSEQDRPREKMILNGPSSLSDSELLAILIRTGTPEMNALELARFIMNECDNDISKLGKLSVDELMNKIKGIGLAKAVTIIASLELGRRRRETSIEKKVKISSPEDLFNYFYPILADLQHEEFWMLSLDRKNEEIRRKKISQGGLSQTIVNVQMIIKEALDVYASSIVICHNHPSGNKEASEEDRRITRKIVEACKLFDIDLLDHIIICQNQFMSFHEEGLI